MFCKFFASLSETLANKQNYEDQIKRTPDKSVNSMLTFEHFIVKITMWTSDHIAPLQIYQGMAVTCWARRSLIKGAAKRLIVSLEELQRSIAQLGDFDLYTVTAINHVLYKFGHQSRVVRRNSREILFKVCCNNILQGNSKLKMACMHNGLHGGNLL